LHQQHSAELPNLNLSFLEYISVKLFHFQAVFLLLIFSRSKHQPSSSAEIPHMTAAQPALKAQYQAINDEPEIKRVITPRPLAQTLSEWDRARETSKTWSMEQD